MDTLWISVLRLVYSAAEFYPPVWLNSLYTNRIDAQLHESMCTVSWDDLISSHTLAVCFLLFTTPEVRLKTALVQEYLKSIDNCQLPILSDVACLEQNRLKSRHPAIYVATVLIEDDFDIHNM